MANRTRLGLESLELRTVPTTFGLPWADPTRLTISFAPDGTPVAGRTSDLFSSLNQDRSPDEWQRDVLRAFYTWSSRTNFDVAVVPDGGAAFGTPGRLQGDPRFGDVRVGGNRLTPDVLAVTSPPDPALAGTLAGDVFVNTNYRFKDTPYDLYSVLLHEAGHAFGLPHSADPNSPMFPRFNNTRTGLTAADVTAIQTLYGPRQDDRFEGAAGNGTIATASAVPVPTGYTGATPLLAFADVKTAGDADVFWFDTVPGRDDDHNVTIRVQSSGLSLLAPKVTVFWLENGVPKEVANVKADSAHYTGATLEVTFDGKDDDDGTTRRYFVRVEASEDGPFKTGRYAVAVTFDGVSTVPPANLGAVIAGPYQALGADDLAALLRNPTGALVNRDGGTNETPATATALGPTTAFNGASRSEAVGSLASAADVDVYRVTAPAGGPKVLTVNAWALPGQAARPRVEVFDAAGGRVPAEVLVNDGGAYTVQAAGLSAGAAYFVRVAGTGAAGNYYLTADFGAVATDVRTFAEGPLPAGVTRTDTLYVGQAQLFHFALTADAAGVPPGATVTVRVIGPSGTFVLTATAGETVSLPAVLLRPGEYRVEFTATGSAVPVTFRLRGNRVTDPVGPVAEDVSLLVEYKDPDRPDRFRYPDDFLSIDPFYWVPGLI
ncbi:MAG: hypothetical protein C0501_16095 [Isosphaera sp.]|nr:hypothetical protein [Isosphaera sp.]